MHVSLRRLTLIAFLCVVSFSNAQRSLHRSSNNSQPKKEWILYVDGIGWKEVPKTLIKDCCKAAEETVDGLKCVDSWQTAAYVEGRLDRKDRVRVVRRMRSVPSLPPGATVDLEENLEVVEGAVMKQKNAPLNLGRLDNERNKHDHIYRYSATGKGVSVYILDTAINIAHNEFRYKNDAVVKRATVGLSQFGKESDPSCAGHGTHVAGIVGGLRCGVAKEADIIMVEVQPCSTSGSTRYVLRGLDWLLNNAKLPAVAQMSLVALGESRSLNQMVKNVIDAGITFVISSGNYGADAKNYSPAMVREAIVVGNVDSKDVLQSLSNYGDSVDIFAPGVSIIGPSAADEKGYRYLTGTSQAAPHVSGVAAQFLELHPNAKPSEVKAHLIKISAKDKIKDTKGSPNRILQTEITEDLPIMPQQVEVPKAKIVAEDMLSIVFYHSANHRSGESLLSTKTGSSELAFATEKRSIRVTNKGNSPLAISVDIDSRTASSVKWIQPSVRSGVVPPDMTIGIDVRFVAKRLKEGIHEAQIVIKTTYFDILLAEIPVKAYLFCGRISADQPVVTLTNAELKLSDNNVNMTGILWFRQPIAPLTTNTSQPLLSALVATDGGRVEWLEDYVEEGPLCSAFSLRAIIPSPASKLNETFCLKLKADQIRDVRDAYVPETEICLPRVLAERDVELYGSDMIYSSDEGIVTTYENVSVIAVFSDVVHQPNATEFRVEPYSSVVLKSISALKPENKVYQVRLAIDKNYYGQISVRVIDHLYDPEKRRVKLKEERSLRFIRTRIALVHHRGFLIKDEL